MTEFNQEFLRLANQLKDYPKDDIIVNLTKSQLVGVLQFASNYDIEGVNNFAKLFNVENNPIISELKDEVHRS